MSLENHPDQIKSDEEMIGFLENLQINTYWTLFYTIAKLYTVAEEKHRAQSLEWSRRKKSQRKPEFILIMPRFATECLSTTSFLSGTFSFDFH